MHVDGQQAVPDCALKYGIATVGAAHKLNFCQFEENQRRGGDEEMLLYVSIPQQRISSN
jgi:hypothetical protein